MSTMRQRQTPKLGEVKVLRRQDFTPELWVIWIEKPEGYTFKAGQYCTIGVDGVERAYSIVSAPHEESMELFIELVPLPDGVLTPKLYEVGVGDSVTIRPRAKGLFTLKPDYPNHLLVATVTGIVPYMSYIREYLLDKSQDNHFYVLHGASYVHEFTYDQELERLARDHPDVITYVPTISRPSEEPNRGWNGETGRVNLIVERYVEKFGLTPEDTLISACGHPAMIEDVKAMMKPRGFRVEEERYWKEG